MESLKEKSDNENINQILENVFNKEVNEYENDSFGFYLEEINEYK